jgi:hypothetical protein
MQTRSFVSQALFPLTFLVSIVGCSVDHPTVDQRKTDDGDEVVIECKDACEKTRVTCAADCDDDDCKATCVTHKGECVTECEAK